ncbi:ABC transporter ATP-binding protein [Ruthenibacterium lactatiformans]|uniref:ATP-binding cassette domain-containing protein n=1 Tax=Ruthenibacterium lactatiformans TaxID=1550024 RepID=A0A6L6LVD2_9FIRM|nr:ABC transporter ATP-binding protein [Ruthenibacterium lactatiformans]MTQ81981.1 ATP-binding cassette domain-containing protein [Ruthenibacterium lactatiformans]MTS21821.1 ATP-binding cassette domain-containing protein [Ruthenibacterium lactatiformans]MTS28793.1 ATP-binding cassette domain-containing protein [Ruthenibacterium lactatiformans]MTS32454.1 ATP-binding cassette domain-containing protein [Ruthenibacterium lactatiformans]MTS39277.1 ATP-binding cassette domain-containing protein [Rut
MSPRVSFSRAQKPKNAKGTLRRILRYTMRYRSILILLLALTFVSNVGNLLGPAFAGKAIGAAAGEGDVDFPVVAYYAKCMLAAYLFSNLLSFAVNQGMMRLGRRIANRMRTDVFDKLMAMPVSYFDRNQAGDIISRVSYDIDVVTMCISADLVQILTGIVTVLGSLVMMFVISPPMIVCLAVTLPVSVLFTRHMSRRTRPLYARRSAAYGTMNGYVEEMFSGQKTILAYAYEDGVCREFSGINQDAADAYCAAETLSMKTGPTVGLFNNLGLSIIGITGAMLYMAGFAGMAQISSFVLYSRKFSAPINEISNILNEIYSALSAAERVFALLDEAEESVDAPGAAVLEHVVGCVQAENVSFGYIPGKTILHDLTLTAEPGQTIAIVGHTGAGKTTLINLLMRFYDVDSGRIFVDGREIRSVTRDSLRRSYAMVLQETWVFEGTVFENIAYGREGATMDDVVRVAKAARIHDTILRLPAGYDTVITEDGGNISKGQKQLLTIARAMLCDAPMLILDEATSNVDTETEQKVQTAMRELMRGKTSFVITHRLSTIQNADCILVMDHGDVIEQGTHDALMKRRGAYYALYAAQFE